ncbi:Tspan33 [Lemmus lemmus]
MFLLTFCGCIGSLRENICLLQTFSLCLTIVFLLQLAAGILGFVFSDKARGKVSELINNAIVHYRDDLDLQNLIDFGQKKFSCCGGISYRDWSQNMYFNCSEDNPSRERCSVPYSCCLPTPNQAVINTMCGQGMQALDYLEASKVIYTNGCIDKLVNWIHSNLFLLGGVALGLAIPQVRSYKLCKGCYLWRHPGIGWVLTWGEGRGACCLGKTKPGKARQPLSAEVYIHSAPCSWWESCCPRSS